MANIDIKKILLGVILVIITIVIIFTIVGETSGSLISAADNASGSMASTRANGTIAALPLSGFFSSSGILMLVLMVAIFLATLILIFKSFKDK